MTTPTRLRWSGLPVFGLIILAVAVLGVIAAGGASEEYASLDRPSWAPPSWLFGPAWTFLYILIALAGWIVWSDHGLNRSIWVYAVQLLLNALWTPLFFAVGWYGVAFAEITLLWLSIVATIVLFWRQNRFAAVLLVPYLLWVTYAGALNFAIWRLN